MGSLNNIAKSAIISYISIFTNILVSFFYTPWMIHKIGVSDYGLYNLVLTFISYFIMDFGLNSSVTRFIAKYRAEDDRDKIQKLLGITFKVFIVIDVIIFLILLISYFYIGNIFKGLTISEVAKVKKLFLIAGGFSVLTFALKPIDGALNAYEIFIPNKIVDLIQRLSVVILVVICLLFDGNVYDLLLVNCIAALICSITKYFIFKAHTRIVINWRYRSKQDTQEIFSFSGWIFLQSLAMRFRLSFIPSVLGIVSNSIQIAVFSLGMSLESLIWTLSAALNGLFLPMVSRLSHQGDRPSIQALMIKVGRIQLFIVFLIYSSFVALGQPFLSLWVGDDFQGAYYVVLALTFSYLISNTTQIASDLVLAENKVRYTTIVTFITSFFGLIGSFFVAKYFGAVGSALCSGVALVINQFFYFPLYASKLKIDVVLFFKECHFKILPLLTLLGGVFYIISSSIAINNWLSLICLGMCYVVSFIAVSYFVLFNNEEKRLIHSVVLNLITKI